MLKPNNDDSQNLDRASPPSSILPPPTDFDENWGLPLSQSDPNIQMNRNHFINRLATTAYNSSSYKVSIGHETVNITEIAHHHRPLQKKDLKNSTRSNERHKFISVQKGANTLSLCFMCFVSATLILISLSVMHLLLKSNSLHKNDISSILFRTTNVTLNSLYTYPPSTSSFDSMPNILVSIYDRSIRDFANAICLLIIMLNCFCLLIFSIEIYLGCNMITTKVEQNRLNFVFSSSTSRFIAICGFYTSIPALILVMCLFILLNMSLIPAIISLSILGLGLVFILITLLTYFSAWKNNHFSKPNDKFSIIHPSNSPTLVPHNISDDDIDISKVDELSTLV